MVFGELVILIAPPPTPSSRRPLGASDNTLRFKGGGGGEGGGISRIFLKMMFFTAVFFDNRPKKFEKITGKKKFKIKKRTIREITPPNVGNYPLPPKMKNQLKK